MLSENWGLISYNDALAGQLEAVAAVSDGAPERLIFCSHPPVVTLGRATEAGDVFSWTGETVEVQRGGRATYHGPSQIVVYPIVSLASRGRDIGKYLRTLEHAVIRTLADIGVTAHTSAPETGVWVSEQTVARKIASIGIGVKRWTTYHGLALNVDHDPEAFRGLKPCGFQSEVMTSVQACLGHAIPRDTLQQRLEHHLTHLLDHGLIKPALTI